MFRLLSSDPDITGGFAPLLTAWDGPDLVVRGELAEDLGGALVRNGASALACLDCRVPFSLHGSWCPAV